MRIAALALAAAVLAAPSPALAHPLGPSLLELRERSPGVFRVRWKTPRRGVPGAEPRAVLPERCSAVAEPVRGGDGEARVELGTIDCGAAGLVGRTVSVAGIEGTRADVLLRVELADGRAFRKVLTASEPGFLVPARESRAAVLADYLALGARHIDSGADHLLFVLGLVLLVPGRTLFWTITAFTVGHSATLSLAVLGFVAPPARAVEAAIALSILVLAVELAHERATPARRFPRAMAATFGLLHGLGFAGALAEAGLPPGDVPLALFAFNLGIELGQLAFVLGVLLAGFAAGRAVRDGAAILRPGAAYVIGSAAAFWLFERIAAIAP